MRPDRTYGSTSTCPMRTRSAGAKSPKARTRASAVVASAGRRHRVERRAIEHQPAQVDGSHRQREERIPPDDRAQSSVDDGEGESHRHGVGDEGRERRSVDAKARDQGQVHWGSRTD